MAETTRIDSTLFPPHPSPAAPIPTFPPFFNVVLPHPSFTPTPRLLPLLPLAIPDDAVAAGTSPPTLFNLLSLSFLRCNLGSLGPLPDLEVPLGRF
ncbi:hypothetical protein B296_00029012 [Ensete ventricosum]|uniref:Uncharacterized protein n=1 Tax=Ensete ventricosum TaxID=4639 RepID=A0A427AEW2_ENSVE|nr:hypothetical protein B296_00029012 [Ensete ventricosum]